MRVIFLLCLASTSVFADIQAGWSVVPDPNAVSPGAIAEDNSQPEMNAPAPVMEGPAPDGAVAAMMAIDPQYFSGILVVTARNGTPVPKQWIILARDSNDFGIVHQLTIADGQVIGDRKSLNTYESVRQSV